MTDLQCSECHDLIPELALGGLDGRQRATALAHIGHCPSCQAELRAMGDVADRLVELTPHVEAPVGFETRVLRHLASTRTAQPSRRSRTHLIRTNAVRLGIAAALAIAIGLGGWAVGHAGAHIGSTPHTNVATAPLVVDGRAAGEVFVSDGPQPAVALALDSSLGDRTVRCELVERDGHTATLASYTLTDGDGYWALPITVPTHSVEGVRLVDTTGHIVATATFPR